MNAPRHPREAPAYLRPPAETRAERFARRAFGVALLLAFALLAWMAVRTIGAAWAGRLG